ncbi:MAG: acyl carrier protein [Actinomycetia bacterium]|nr:acyl carrier protein [Actinomycetes bacterium]
MSNRTTLDEIFRDVLALDATDDTTQLAYGATEGWDSVAHMQLVAALETSFNIMLDTDQVIAMSDYSIVEAILRDSHGVNF